MFDSNLFDTFDGKYTYHLKNSSYSCHGDSEKCYYISFNQIGVTKTMRFDRKQFQKSYRFIALITFFSYRSTSENSKLK